MKKEINIETYFLEISTKNERLHHSINFKNWNDAKTFLKNQIEFKEEREIFKIKLGDKYFGELNKLTFRSLYNIEKEFTKKLEIIQEEKEEEIEKIAEKTSKIEIRISAKEKEKVAKKCKKSGLSISEYTRQLYEYGEILIIPDQVKRDVRGMSVNLNQIAKRINSGAISPNTVIYELQQILEELNKTYNR